MPKRFNRIATAIGRVTTDNVGPWELAVGHPCGFISSSRHLRARPKLSKAVGDFLLSDATMSGDFENMLSLMVVYRLKVSKRVKLHLKQWHKLGCPTWKKNDALSRGLHRLYTGGLADAVPTMYDVRDCSAKFWAASDTLPVDVDGEPVINFDENGVLITV